ncbi:MAG TPA: hypothetical protein GXX35_02545 [Thermoanaerobacterales bacterium]|nr:hypothetical protein [Thermoanaerobacterales bacterium]
MKNNMQETREKCCGTCKFLESRPGKYNLPKTYCGLNGKVRFRNEMKECIGWKERKEGKW